MCMTIQDSSCQRSEVLANTASGQNREMTQGHKDMYVGEGECLLSWGTTKGYDTHHTLPLFDVLA